MCNEVDAEELYFAVDKLAGMSLILSKPCEEGILFSSPYLMKEPTANLTSLFAKWMTSPASTDAETPLEIGGPDRITAVWWSCTDLDNPSIPSRPLSRQTVHLLQVPTPERRESRKNL